MSINRGFYWLLGCLVSILLLTACGDDEDDSSDDSGAGSSGAAGDSEAGMDEGGSSGASGAAGLAGTEGDGTSESSAGDGGSDGTAGEGGTERDSGIDDGGGSSGEGVVSPEGWSEQGEQVSSSSGYSEDPAMLLIEGVAAVGYRQDSFEVNLHLWDEQQGKWGASQPDPTEKQTVASIYRAPDFCYAGDAIYMSYAHAGDGTQDDQRFYDRIFAYRFTVDGGWEVLNGGGVVSQPWNAGEGIGYGSDEASVACRPGSDPVVSWIQTDIGAEQDIDTFVATVTDSDVTRSSRLNRVVADGTDARVSDVEIDDSGSAYLAIFEHSEDASFETHLFAVRHAGGFTDLGGVIDADMDSNDLTPPSILPLGVNDVYLAWSADADDSDMRDVFVAHWDGSDWQPVGDNPIRAFESNHYDSANPDLIMVGSTLTLAWDEADQDTGRYIFVAQYVDDEWQIAGDRLNADRSHEAQDPSLVYDASDDRLYVAFEEWVDGQTDIFVKSASVPTFL